MPDAELAGGMKSLPEGLVSLPEGMTSLPEGINLAEALYLCCSCRGSTLPIAAICQCLPCFGCL